MSTVTADTITDEQIRELRSSYDTADEMAHLCNTALFGAHSFAWARKRGVTTQAARARCATACNARHAGKETP